MERHHKRKKREHTNGYHNKASHYQNQVQHTIDRGTDTSKKMKKSDRETRVPRKQEISDWKIPSRHQRRIEGENHDPNIHRCCSNRLDC